MKKKIKSIKIDDTYTIVRWNCDEVTISCGKEKVTLSHDQASDLRRILYHVGSMLTECEAWIGEVVGMPR